MPASDTTLLLIIAALGVLIIVGIAGLLVRAANAARPRCVTRSFPASTKDQIIWREIGSWSFRSLTGQVRKQLDFIVAKIGRLAPIVRSGAKRDFPQVSDPVDGTGFAPGETIMRCACNTRYHLHSWDWLAEKNGGKCVNCHRAGMGSVTQQSAA